MFTHAGFNPAHRSTGILAMVYREGRGWCRPAKLIRFEAGDLAWRGRGGISWGHTLRFRPFIWVQGYAEHTLPRSRLEP